MRPLKFLKLSDFFYKTPIFCNSYNFNYFFSNSQVFFLELSNFFKLSNFFGSLKYSGTLENSKTLNFYETDRFCREFPLMKVPVFNVFIFLMEHKISLMNGLRVNKKHRHLKSFDKTLVSLSIQVNTSEHFLLEWLPSSNHNA